MPDIDWRAVRMVGGVVLALGVGYRVLTWLERWQARERARRNGWWW